MDREKQRHGCPSVYLVVMIVINGLVGVIYR